MTRYEKFLFACLMAYATMDYRFFSYKFLPTNVKDKLMVNDQMSIMWFIILFLIFYFLIGVISPYFEIAMNSIDSILSSFGISQLISNLIPQNNIV